MVREDLMNEAESEVGVFQAWIVFKRQSNHWCDRLGKSSLLWGGLPEAWEPSAIMACWLVQVNVQPKIKSPIWSTFRRPGGFLGFQRVLVKDEVSDLVHTRIELFCLLETKFRLHYQSIPTLSTLIQNPINAHEKTKMYTHWLQTFYCTLLISLISWNKQKLSGCQPWGHFSWH